MDWLAAIDEATVGVFAWRRSDGTPRSCAVTPYVVDGQLVVTSTLALPGKALAAARRPRVALLANGYLVRADAAVAVDTSPAWFDGELRDQELRKYPPARSLLAIPGHRRWFPWYVGRIVIRFDEPVVSAATHPCDRVTATHVDEAGLHIATLPSNTQIERDCKSLVVPGVPNGPVDVLIHEEHDDFARLGQLHARGSVSDGELHEPTISGDLAPPPTGTIGQLKTLRMLGRAATANAPRVTTLPRISPR